MSQQNRTVLKGYFNTGDTPTEAQFGDLVDSFPLVSEQTAALASAASTTTAALALKADLVSGKVPTGQLPSYVDDVLEYATVSAFPVTGEEGKIYLVTSGDDINTSWRWSGSSYFQIVSGAGLTIEALMALLVNTGTVIATQEGGQVRFDMNWNGVFDNPDAIPAVSGAVITRGQAAAIYAPTSYVDSQIAYVISLIGGASPFDDLDFTGSTGIERIGSTKNWQAVLGGPSGYGNLGKAGMKLPAGVDGRIIMNRPAGGSAGVNMGFNATDAEAGYASWLIGFAVTSAGKVFWIEPAGTAGEAAPDGTIGASDLVCLNRVGTNYTIEKSTDGGATWPTIVYDSYTYASNSSDIWVAADLADQASGCVLTNPRSEGLTA